MRIALVSHGDLAAGVLSAVEMICGGHEEVAAFGLLPSEDGDALSARVSEWMDSCEGDRDVLVLSDLYFGSPFNAMVALSRTKEMYHVTGMNLAMAVEAVSMLEDGCTAEEAAKKLLPLAHEGIVDVNEVLASM